ncbi:PEP-CTERM putative exosortase interaction domain-containing protein [Burkholderiales bacterium JOSHI_001]|nr:PEP-CTERM putative exosortase interaction domain-containing protein [Burkholderiales bacterium JOSHI_001]
MRSVGAAVAAWLVGAAAQAAVTVPADVLGSGVQVATCASLRGSGNGLAIGDAIDSGLLTPGTECFGTVASGAQASAALTAQQDNGLAQAHASGQASMGVLHLSSTLNTPGSPSTSFPAAISQASFVDMMTPNAPGLTGQSGFLLLPIHVSGVLDASGNAGSAAFLVAALKNDITLSTSNPGYVVGTGNQVSTDRQAPTYRAASFPVPGPLSEHQVVDETVVFSVPVVFGTPFEMTLLGQSIAGMRSRDGGGNSSSDFEHTLQWLGASQARLADGSVVSVTTTGASGIDWTLAAAVPEPATWLMLLAGGAVLLARRRASAVR